MASNSTLKGRKRNYCGHCKRYLNKTQFYRHKQLYYDNLARKWSSERVVHQVVVEDKEFSCDIHSPDISSHDGDEQPDFFISQVDLESTEDIVSMSPSPDSLIPADVEDSEVLANLLYTVT